MHFSVWRNLIFVEVETDEGITGIGEATIRNKEMAVKAAIEHHLKPLVVGTSPFQIEQFFQTAFLKDAWRNGAVFNTAISGIEMALWDIIGQKLGVPVYNLLGGTVHDTIPLYANTWFMSAETPEDFAHDAEKTVGLGFHGLKWDPLKAAPNNAPEKIKVQKGLECLKLVRKAVGPDIDLYVELHGTLSYEGALKFAVESEQYDPAFLEEPMHPDEFAAYRKLVAVSRIPIAAGERYFTRFAHRQLNEEGFLTVVQPDLTHCGGIWETKKMAAAAEAYGMKFAPHNSSGPVATIASAMVDVSCPNFKVQEFSIENLELSKRFFNDSLDIRDGNLYLSNAPGLGLNPDWKKIRTETYKYFQTF